MRFTYILNLISSNNCCKYSINLFTFIMHLYCRLCGGCNRDIGYGNYLGCMGTYFHPECFRCRSCGHPITEHEVYILISLNSQVLLFFILFTSYYCSIWFWGTRCYFCASAYLYCTIIDHELTWLYLAASDSILQQLWIKSYSTHNQLRTQVPDC